MISTYDCLNVQVFLNNRYLAPQHLLLGVREGFKNTGGPSRQLR